MSWSSYQRAKFKYSLLYKVSVNCIYSMTNYNFLIWFNEAKVIFIFKIIL